MRRAAAVLLAIGAAALLLAWLLLRDAAEMLESYLPAWLFCLAVPLGALPLLMGMELAGAGRTVLANALRRVLLPLPLAALLAVPLLLHPAVHTGLPDFAARWWRPAAASVREAAFLVVWTLLGLVFVFPPSPTGGRWRRPVATLGLLLHPVLGTLAALDWAMALEPGLNSSAFGLLVMAAQSGAALSAAVLLAAALGDARAITAAARPMLALLGVWLFLQFSQYLIVWSANLPGEITWYQHRQAGLGTAAAWLAVLCCAAALLGLLPRRLAARVPVVVTAAAVLLLLHAMEALWLTTPAWRGRFVVSGADLLPMLGLASLLAAGLLVSRDSGQKLARV